MAWTASGLYYVTFRDVFDPSAIAIDLTLTTHKVAMYNNTETPDFTSESAYAATNEVSGTAYSAGGKDLTGLAPAVSDAGSATFKFDMGDISWASSSISNARGSKLYADALAGNNLIVAHNFGADFSTSNGTFTIQWHANGVFTIDLTP